MFPGMGAPQMPAGAGTGPRPEAAAPNNPQWDPSQPLTAEVLAAAPSGLQKQMLGEKIFAKVFKINPEQAGKITGMMLELHNSELLGLLDDPASLQSKVATATTVSAPQGVSVDFLVNRFDRILQKQFGAKYNEKTTFADLAVMLWGPANACFSKVVDLLGHASFWDESRGASGVSLCKAIGERCAADVGIATLFISWTWRYSVKKFLETLRNYCADKGLAPASTFAWVCFLCNNQFDWLSGVMNDGVETFGETVQQIGNVVCFVDSFNASASLYFSRLWPVFEVFVACSCGVDIDFALMSDSEQELLGATIGELKESIKVDVMNASASDENDARKIKALIADADGGARAINTKVAKLFLSMVARFLVDD